MITLTKIGLSMMAMMLVGTAQAGSVYSFTSFDGPGNNAGGTTVNGINQLGQVVGFSSDNAASPTLLTNFIRNPDGSFVTLNINGDPLAMANGIDAVDAVVGGSNNGAFFLSGGTVTMVPPVNGTTVSETAFGVNDGGLGGLVVGQYTDSSTDTQPGFLAGLFGFTTLVPTVTATVTNAQGINNEGLVTGFYSADGVHQHGFFYDATTATYTLPPDPNIPNLVFTQFLGLNDDGTAVGYYGLPDGSQHGFLFNILTDTYTFLDDPSAATSGLSITQITGINDSGEITGFYVDATSGLQRGFVANPDATAPEPGSFGLLLGGVLMVGAGIARRIGSEPRA